MCTGGDQHPDEEGEGGHPPVQVPLRAGGECLGLHPRRVLRNLRPALGVRQVTIQSFKRTFGEVVTITENAHAGTGEDSY